jgi:hypothetical protein
MLLNGMVCYNMVHYIQCNGTALQNDTWGERPIFIPATFRNPRRQPFLSPAPATPLPQKIGPIGLDNEKRLITALIEEINKFYGMGIDPNASLERGCVTQGAEMSRSRTVLVGASHMTRLADGA